MIKEILQSEYDEVYSFVNEECGNEKDAFESEDAKKRQMIKKHLLRRWKHDQGYKIWWFICCECEAIC